jgi:hypothetical protein
LRHIVLEIVAGPDVILDPSVVFYSLLAVKFTEFVLKLFVLLTLVPEVDGVGELWVVVWVCVALLADIFVCVLEVEGVGDECGVLAVSVDDVEEGGVEAGVAIVGVAQVLAVVAGAAGIGMKSTEQSPLGTVIQLNLNSGTLSGLPVRSQ